MARWFSKTSVCFSLEIPPVKVEKESNEIEDKLEEHTKSSPKEEGRELVNIRDTVNKLDNNLYTYPEGGKKGYDNRGRKREKETRKDIDEGLFDTSEDSETPDMGFGFTFFSGGSKGIRCNYALICALGSLVNALARSI